MHKCPSAICLFYPNPSEGQIKHALDGVECSVPGEIIGVKQLAQRHNCRRWLSLQVIRVQWKLNRQAPQIKCFIFNFHSPPRGTDFYFLLIQFVLQSLHLGFYYEVVSPVLSLEDQLGGKAEDDFFWGIPLDFCLLASWSGLLCWCTWIWCVASDTHALHFIPFPLNTYLQGCTGFQPICTS